MWRGCTKVSEGCKHCYAETLSRRNPKTLGVWGPKGSRVIASEKYWQQPLKWNKAAEAAGERHRVFCASLADVFEGDETMPEESRKPVHEARARLFALIEETPHLDWLLLTKRPENIEWVLRVTYTPTLASLWHKLEHGYLPNVWLGASVENQQTADERIPHLLKVPAVVRFLSCEPLLGTVELRAWIPAGAEVCEKPAGFDAMTEARQERIISNLARAVYISRCEIGIHWVIVGGESGAGARPMHPDWARSIRDQCQAAKVPYFFKQWGEYLPFEEAGQAPFWIDQTGKEWDGHGLDIIDPETGDIGKGWHEDSLHSDCACKKVGKKLAGRLLDGREWNEMPEVAR
jgi:protein gp37